MKISIYQIDAFTGRLFGGNPAAVCPLPEWLDPQTMQNIAAENNLSETAFYVKKGDQFEIRWFTPEIEVDLCGHATLASAHVIFNYSDFKGDVIPFQTLRSGELRVSKTNDMLTLDFPATKPEPVPIPAQLAEALGTPPVEVYKSRDILALFDREEDIVSMKPNFGLLLNLLTGLGCLGMIVTAPGNQSDFVSRFFAPPAGIDEDPVTGSAHTTLTPFWAERLDKPRLHAFQLSRRGGELFCQLSGHRVLISGKAVTYMKGEIEF
ncbi:MAG: PhzF family phenazine biosynthesis isomerase [Candidatus Aminicenantes bacterium]|nr:PhzF family phenazine biosynthesis isomerase [Candidatus Aminicenantes bacterium]NIM77870.1 PhzF family phenazine biosynthesis isomerase [Candidatus Aminicenantes bacterium]NIN17183.1 PhzF family phenazine biosynthesis isomerase [Candidatus Aminicenantes bacterium]NIN41076.1 PhzF family phenazine biosynthesis isomerase [Candidatus Aminicenantes bacterium]NIN83881.1 PhzF family phenazine biosynthesis isomerase [Candidatus Aminicenantes bacterium]